MNQNQLALMIPIFTVLGAFTMVVFLRRYQYLERMAMLERGINPKETKELWNKKRDPYRHIRLAFTAIGVGIGLFLGIIFRRLDFLDYRGIQTSLIFIFGGIGLLIGYAVQMSLQKRGHLDDKEPHEGDEI